MANNSFLIKGWAVTLNVAILSLSKDDIDSKIISITIFLTLLFWILDAYFLKQERIFRQRYDEVRIQSENEIDFSMEPISNQNSITNYFVVAFSKTLSIFYGIHIIAIFLFWNLF
jgi:hypothetical protein